MAKAPTTQALAAILALLLSHPSFAATPPQLSAVGHNAYADYLAAAEHRAFAVAPGGAWGWEGGTASREIAEEMALAACRGNTEQKCVLYSVDGKPVFDAKAWPQLWGPYTDARSAQRASVGQHVGQRFPDLAFAAADAHKLAVSGLRNKVVMLHFWGSWCGPCRREMPDLQKLYESLKDHRDVVFVLLQVREDFATSQRWTSEQKLRLPFHDSGATSADRFLRTADGGRIADRDIAMTFPTTYVLDKRGIVIFSHTGPVPDWSEYREFILDAVKRSGH